MGAFMIILYSRAGSQYQDQLDKAQSSTVWGGQPSLSMPANPHQVCLPMDSCGQWESNLGVVHETNEPYPLPSPPLAK